MPDITGRTNGVWRAQRPVDGDDMGLLWVCICTQCNNETRVYPRARFERGGSTAKCKDNRAVIGRPRKSAPPRNR